MADRIRVLIVDDILETRDHLAKLLGFESDVDVVGMAPSGEEAIAQATKLLPDVILMDINMPDMDGITATERLSSQVPTAGVVMMSVQGEADYLRRSMLAGAREFLVKPFSSDELTASIRQVYSREKEEAGRAVVTAAARNAESAELGTVVAVFSPKGGVGRTTIAVNLAVASVTELNKKVVLVDGSFQFGDVAVLLNLDPKDKSMFELVSNLEAGGDADAVETYTVTHSSGVRVILAPPSPEMADVITSTGVKRVVEALRQRYELVVIDCAAWFNDTTLGILDLADIVLVVLTLEMTSIKNIRLFLEVAETLGYQNKIRLVLNRADTTLGIRVADVEHSIGRKVDNTIVSDGRAVVYALNRGVPFVLSNREAQVAQDVLRLATAVTGNRQSSEDDRKAIQKGKSLFARR
jgi:pilus assembly protein CpaE